MKILAYSKNARQVLVENLTNQTDIGRTIIICKDELTEEDLNKEIKIPNIEAREQNKFFDEIADLVVQTSKSTTKDELRSKYGDNREALLMLEEAISHMDEETPIVTWMEMGRKVIKRYDTVVLADAEDLDELIQDFVMKIRLVEKEDKPIEFEIVEDNGGIERKVEEER